MRIEKRGKLSRGRREQLMFLVITGDLCGRGGINEIFHISALTKLCMQREIARERKEPHEQEEELSKEKRVRNEVPGPL